ncbi:hypothetical protein DENSPDRAFT_897347 [Dentipellis sp. KUC8613]|nr:hypothetical protein DENSPDRAFT_897347 [Dentipellis sp. KUC8613]
MAPWGTRARPEAVIRRWRGHSGATAHQSTVRVRDGARDRAMGREMAARGSGWHGAAQECGEATWHGVKQWRCGSAWCGAGAGITASQERVLGEGAQMAQDGTVDVHHGSVRVRNSCTTASEGWALGRGRAVSEDKWRWCEGAGSEEDTVWRDTRNGGDTGRDTDPQGARQAAGHADSGTGHKEGGARCGGARDGTAGRADGGAGWERPPRGTKGCDRGEAQREGTAGHEKGAAQREDGTSTVEMAPLGLRGCGGARQSMETASQGVRGRQGARDGVRQGARQPHGARRGRGADENVPCETGHTNSTVGHAEGTARMRMHSAARRERDGVHIGRGDAKTVRLGLRTRGAAHRESVTGRTGRLRGERGCWRAWKTAMGDGVSAAGHPEGSGGQKMVARGIERARRGAQMAVGRQDGGGAWGWVRRGRTDGGGVGHETATGREKGGTGSESARRGARRPTGRKDGAEWRQRAWLGCGEASLGRRVALMTASLRRETASVGGGGRRDGAAGGGGQETAAEGVETARRGAQGAARGVKRRSSSGASGASVRCEMAMAMAMPESSDERSCAHELARHKTFGNSRARLVNAAFAQRQGL